MKKIKLLIFALLCALPSTLVSCDMWKDAIENSITNTWVCVDDDYYYSYRFYSDGTYYYETGYVLNSGNFEETGFDSGYYDFSNYRKELILESDYSYKIITYNAYISNGVLRIEDTVDQLGTWYYSTYYKQ